MVSEAHITNLHKILSMNQPKVRILDIYIYTSSQRHKQFLTWLLSFVHQNQSLALN